MIASDSWSFSDGGEDCSGVAPTGAWNSTIQKSDGTGHVDISVEIDDPYDYDTMVKMEYESDFDGVCDGPWAAATLLGPAIADFDDTGGAPDVGAGVYQVGATATTRIITSSGSNTVDFDWDSATDLSGLVGTHCIRLTANNDTTDQVTPAAITIGIDNDVPADPVVYSPTESEVLYDTTPQFSGTGELGATVNVYDGSGHACSSVVDGSLNWICEIAVAMANGTSALFSVDQTDAVGNTSTPPVEVNVTVSLSAGGGSSTYNVSKSSNTAEEVEDEEEVVEEEVVVEEEEEVEELVEEVVEEEVEEESDEEVDGCDIPFVDVSDHWSEKYVTALYCADIIHGDTDTEYNPDSAVSRIEFLKMVLLTFGYEIEGLEDLEMSEVEKIFEDFELDEWYSHYLQVAYDEGIISGYDDGTFMPYKDIVQAEALKMLLEAAGYEVIESDEDVNWYDMYVRTAEEEGVLTEFDTPGAEISRSDAAEIMWNYLETGEVVWK